jgi:hypothetical protein
MHVWSYSSHSLTTLLDYASLNVFHICILVDEQDNVVGHESNYNGKILFCYVNLFNLMPLTKLFGPIRGTPNLICYVYAMLGHLDNLLRRAFSVFLFNSKYELLLQFFIVLHFYDAQFFSILLQYCFIRE